MAVDYFLVCHILLLLTPGQALQYGRQGSETTLDPVIPGTPEKILWKHGARKVLEFDGSEESVYGTFLDRVVLDWHTASLTIRDLQGKDSGLYELEATVYQKKYYSQHEVAVIEKVAVPTISCVINGTDGGHPEVPQTLAALMCSAEGPPSLITYHWTLLHGVHGGPELLVSLAGEQDETVYTCWATNPVSQEMGKFVAKDCYPDNFPYTGVIVSVIVICLLLVFAECFWCYRKWKKAHPKHNDVEKQPWHRTSQGPDNMRTHDEDKERESLLCNGSTLPSSQPLALLSHSDPATRPLDSASELEEDDTTKQVSEHSSETKLPESHHLTDLDSKCNAGDSACESEEPGSESESNLPPTASPVGCGLHPVVIELDAMQTHNVSSPEVVEEEEEEAKEAKEEEEEERLDTGVACVSTGDEPRYECLVVAADDPQVNVEVLPSEVKEEEVINYTKAPHGDAEVPEEGEVEEGDGKDGGVASLTEPASGPETQRDSEAVAGESDTHTSEEEEKTLGTPEDKHENADDGTRQVAFPAEPGIEALERREEEESNNVTETSHDDAEVPEEGEVEEGDGKDGGMASLTELASGPETHRDSEAVAGESDTHTSEEEEEKTLGTPEDKHENAEDGTRLVAFSAEPGVEAPEEGEVEQDDGKGGGVAILLASQPETHCDSEAEAGESDTDTSMEEGTPEDKHENAEDGTRRAVFSAEPCMESSERKEEKEDDDDVAETLLDEAGVQEEGEVEEDGGREGETTSLTEMDSDPEPGESRAGQEETQGTGGNHDENKDEREEGPLSDNLDVEEAERRDGNKEAETNAKKEAVTE